MKKNKGISRRKLVGGLGLSAGALAVGDFAFAPSVARADGGDILEESLLVFVYFSGAWDTLLCLDPRDHQVFGNKSGAKGIYTGFEEARTFDAPMNAFLDVEPSGVYQPSGSNIGFGPGVLDSCISPCATIGSKFADHYADMCVIKGVEMGTLTHEVGLRYFLTGKFPRGVLASGSALGTWVASQDPSSGVIPNLVVGGYETVNEGLDPQASGLEIASVDDLKYVLQTVGQVTVPSAIQQAVAEHHGTDHCVHQRLDPRGDVSAYRAGWNKATELLGGSLFGHFDFVANPPAGGEIDEVYTAFNINPANPTLMLNGPAGRCAVAAQAIVNDLSRAVSFRINPVSLDTHFNDWQTSHAARLRVCFEAVADLITFLKQAKDGNNKSYWERTTLALVSEFARTPLLNNQTGRDHHLCNSVVLAGNGIEGNQVVGQSDPDGYDVVPYDFEAQKSDPTKEEPITPADVHATICRAMDIPYGHIENQEPKVLEVVLKS